MSKRNISYIKPQDPSFLRKLKEEIGYKEGPTVDTKRQKLEDLDEGDSSEDGVNREEREDEKPQVVVLKTGDLTAEEADAETKRIRKEEEEKPADLNQRIIFRPKVKAVDPSTVAKKTSEKSKSKDKKANKSKLSFDDNDEEEDY